MARKKTRKLKKMSRARVQSIFGTCAIDCRKTACKRGKTQDYGVCMRTCQRKHGVKLKRGRK